MTVKNFDVTSRWTRTLNDTVIASMWEERLPGAGRPMAAGAVAKGIARDVQARAEDAAFLAEDKLTDWDVERLVMGSPMVAAGAVQWLYAQDGKLDGFLSDMIGAYEYRGLTVPQLRGVLNCIRARMLRDVQPFEAPAPVAPAAPVAGSLDRIRQLLETAAASGLRYPKITVSTDDDTVVCVQLAGARARQPGTVNVTDGQPYGQNVWYGRIGLLGQPDSTLQGHVAVLAVLQALAADPEAVLNAHGLRTGQCGVCRRTLTAEESVDRGIGPICYGRMGF